jgi:TRAP-type mannitol/chloroaromatic compound transport system permease small subunit
MLKNKQVYNRIKEIIGNLAVVLVIMFIMTSCGTSDNVYNDKLWY